KGLGVDRWISGRNGPLGICVQRFHQLSRRLHLSRSACVFLLVFRRPGLLYFPYPHGWITPQGPLLRPLPERKPTRRHIWGSAMFGIGFSELLVVMVIALFLFGNRLPEVARSLGKSLTEFRKEARHLDEEVRGPVR